MTQSERDYINQQTLNRLESKYLDPPEDKPDEEEFEDPIDYYEEAQLRRFDAEREEKRQC